MDFSCLCFWGLASGPCWLWDKALHSHRPLHPTHPLFLGSRGIGGPSPGGCVLVSRGSTALGLMSPGLFKASCTQLDPPVPTLLGSDLGQRLDSRGWAASLRQRAGPGAPRHSHLLLPPAHPPRPSFLAETPCPTEGALLCLLRGGCVPAGLGASGDRPRPCLRFLCPGWESASSSLGSCAASVRAAPPRARGLWSAQGLTFSRAKLKAAAPREKLQAYKGELETCPHVGAFVLWVQVPRFC